MSRAKKTHEVVAYLLFSCAACLFSSPTTAAAASGELLMQVIDKDTKLPIAVRMHLKDQRGKPVVAKRVPNWKGHFVFAGSVKLKLKPGVYTFEIERGPEYRIRYGNFTIRGNDQVAKEVDLPRYADMKKEGWWSGDLHVHRDPKDIQLLMLAEDLHVAPVITWWNKRNLWKTKDLPDPQLVQFDGNRFYHLMAGEDEREGGALLYFNLDKPLPITEAKREYPSPVKFLKMASLHEQVHVDVEKPFWWDVPIWLASRKIHSIGLAHNHMQRDGVLGSEAWGKARDKLLYPGAHGNGNWTQHIYYQILNSGLRVPPSAGSASGVLPNPVGYNRVYVQLDGELTYQKWFQGLRAGRVVVTNGPLMQPRFNGKLPGHIFKAPAGESVELTTQLNLSLREKVEYLELVRDGKVIHEVRLEDYAKKSGKLPPVAFQESGWLLVRAVTNNANTYRFASSGPVYVEIGDRPRISRKASKFFLDWVNERAERVKLSDPKQREQVLLYHGAARDFWQKRLDTANAE